MSAESRKYTRDEIARRGDEIYEQEIRSQLEADHAGRVVAIDIETRQFAVADEPARAAEQLWLKSPAAEIWFVRIGHRALHRIGARTFTIQA